MFAADAGPLERPRYFEVPQPVGPQQSRRHDRRDVVRHFGSLRFLERQQDVVALDLCAQKPEILIERGGARLLSAQREFQIPEHLFDRFPVLVQIKRRARQHQEIIGITD